MSKFKIQGNASGTGTVTVTAPNTNTDYTITLPADNGNLLLDTALSSTVQPYDADTAKTDVAQTYTASQRGTVVTDNDLSFDMNAGNNFSCTPTLTGTITFTNITEGQSGNIYLDNSAGVVISAAATTYMDPASLSTINTAGKYWLSYYCADGTNVIVSATGATTSTGV